ncbi:hypothetical protein WICMUC_005422 [Wickerhamomyces mucosus]|uniref:Protein ROT1 n=1 Tax=Wickerhamomyces mucosus TaxID=1378264 RepID=A0A9P8P8P9_9ASCO|nr:hypothetical protein WICMUC_005422 [Wickerhamomyces mucosus]
MKIVNYLSSAFVISLIQSLVKADDESDSIEGTWSSKSNTVFTGPGFFDPVDELLIEPALPGISYSFTDDGYFEQAIYQVTSNPKNHSCAAAALIYQHGTYEIFDNGSISLTPFTVDGRQLLSKPCDDDGISSYTRYEQQEFFKSYSVEVDPYYGRYKLNLFAFDGSVIQPLYLAYRPPLMLPTETLNPTSTNDVTQASSTSSSNKLRKRIKRSLENKGRTTAIRKNDFNVDLWWYLAAGVIAIGSGIYFIF